MSNKRRALIAIVAVLAGGIALHLAQETEAEPTTAAGAPLVQVVVPELTGNARSGEVAFNQYCATCHGRNAAGQDGVAPPLIHVIYEPNHHGDAAFLFAARRGARAHHWPFGDMPPVEGVSDEEIGQIVAYVRTLQRANGIY